VLLVVGRIIAGIGLVWILAPTVPWLGWLPGDIVIEKENTRAYFPITTCILVNLLLRVLMWAIRYFAT